MSNQISEREQLHSDMGRNSERGIYDEMPSSLLKLSQTLDNVLAIIGEEKKDLFFARTDVESRSGARVALLTQGPKYHQYDVITHLDVAGWAASNPEKSIFTFVSPQNIEFLESEIKKNMDREALILACYLHDIEKPFKPRRKLDMAHPWDVRTRKSESGDILTTEDKVLLDNISPDDASAFRIKFAQLLCEGAKTDSDARIAGFSGLLKNEVNEQKVLEYVKAYSELDSIVIEANKQKLSSTEDLGKLLDNFITTHSKEDIIAAAYVVLVDNYAVGVPPLKDRYEDFEAQVGRVVALCNILISSTAQD